MGHRVAVSFIILKNTDSLSPSHFDLKLIITPVAHGLILHCFTYSINIFLNTQHSLTTVLETRVSKMKPIRSLSLIITLTP